MKILETDINDISTKIKTKYNTRYKQYKQADIVYTYIYIYIIYIIYDMVIYEM